MYVAATMATEEGRGEGREGPSDDKALVRIKDR